MGKISKSDNYNTWLQNGPQDTSVEYLMDQATYTSAHPDDTIVLVGPPRLDGLSLDNLATVGMVQNISINQSKPFQPMMALGSSRSFYMAGKAQGSAQVGRLFLNTDSLMKRLYKNAIDQGVDPTVVAGSVTNTPMATVKGENFYVNLDSNFFLLPFGLGIMFKDKTKRVIGGLYLELACIPNYTIAVQAGQSMIMEGVSILFDRVVALPLPATQNTEILADFLKNQPTTAG